MFVLNSCKFLDGYRINQLRRVSQSCPSFNLSRQVSRDDYLLYFTLYLSFVFYRKVASLLFLKTKDFVFCFLQKVKDHFVKSSSRWAFVLICGCKDMAFIFKRQIFEQLFLFENFLFNLENYF
jgi:hypothetical protein